MLPIRSLLLSSLFIVWAVAAVEQPVGHGARQWLTWIADAPTTVAMHERIGVARSDLQQRIDQAQERLAAALDGEGRAHLAAEQAAWLLHARALARLRADRYRGGSFAGVAHGRALVASQCARIDQLLELHRVFTEP